jgi:hypothetical protein
MSKRRLPTVAASMLALCCLAIRPGQAGEGWKLVGKVVWSKGASLGGVALPSEGTILTRDILDVGKGGRAVVSFSPTARAALAEQSAVRFGIDSGHVAAQILSGTIAVEEARTDGVAVKTSKYSIGPQSSEVEYFVALMPDRSTLVGSRHGKVTITETGSGKSYTLAEGLYAEIPASATGVPAQETTGQQQSGSRRKALKGGWHIGSLSHAASVGLVVAIAGGTAAAIAIPLASSGAAASPSAP